MAYIFGSIWDRFNRNALNNLSQSVEAQGKSIQDLVAKGQLTPTQYATLIESINGLIKKGQLSVDDIDINKGRIGLHHLSAEVKAAMVGETPILSEVADFAVTESTIYPGAVTPEKTNFISVGKNKFNYKNVVKDKYISENSGAWLNLVGYVTSDFIPVFKNVSIHVNKASKIIYYDLSMQYISGVGQSQSSYTGTPAQDGYIRICVDARNTTYTDVQVEYNDTRTPFESYRYIMEDSVTVKNALLTSLTPDSVDVSAIKNGSVTEEKTSFIKNGKNLFNPKKVIKNKLYAGAGEYVGSVDSSIYHASQAFPMTAGDSLTISKFRNFFYQDESGQIINTSYETNYNYTYTASVDGYVVFSLFQEDLYTTQVEKGKVATSFEGFKNELDQTININRSSLIGDTSGFTVKKDGGTFDISSTLNGKVLTLQSQQNGSLNDGFNFQRTIYDGEVIHNTGDDITPVRTFNTVGANHGYTSIVDLPNTNKVTADLGSVWTDGTNEFVLLRIVEGRLKFSMPYVEGANGVTVPVVNPTADLTHVRNATNTGSISISGRVSAQLRPSTGKVVSQYKADGNLITEDGDYNADEIVVVDSYDILDYKSIVEWAKNNVGIDYARYRSSIDGVLSISNTYVYYAPGKCITSHSIYALKTVEMGRTGVLQSVALRHPSLPIYRYVHNVDTVNGINFKSPINLADYNTTCYVLRAHLIDSTKPVDRYVDYIGSGSNKLIAFSMGHVIDKTNSKQSDRMANVPGVLWDFRSTKKSYPTVLENKILQAGDYYNFQGYRDYYIPKSSTLNSNISSDNSADYIYIDEQSSGSFKALKDESLIGKELELIDSRNFTLLSDVADSQGISYRTTGSNAYGVIKAK